MKKKPEITAEDQNLFRNAVQDVRPLKKTNRISPLPHRKNPYHRKQSINTDETESERYRISDFLQNDDFCNSNEHLIYKKSGIQNQQLKKLKQGKLTIEASLDLHGLNINQARSQLDTFIQYCMSQEFRCITIIHGKGSHGKMPILKSMVNHWLQQIPDVLAFSSAQTHHGGAGALYVLLRKNR